MTVPGDIVDNDCDGFIDEELLDGNGNVYLTLSYVHSSIQRSEFPLSSCY